MIITIPAEHEDAASAFLIELGAAGVWVETNSAAVHLHIFFPMTEKGKIGAIRNGLQRLIPEGNVALSTALRPEEAWQTAWQRHSVPVQRIGKNLLIGAPWHFPLSNPARRKEIQLAPGMAFGTGTHATTRSCLALLDRLITPSVDGELLDVGTGSGILAIAGAKLGAEQVTAVENDPVALAVARENAKINGMAQKISFRKTFPRRRYRWVVANMTGPVLMELSGMLARSVAPGGTLILSGILARESGEVLLRYRGGFALERKIRKGEWITLLLQKKKR